jgi:hypothetical protein
MDDSLITRFGRCISNIDIIKYLSIIKNNKSEPMTLWQTLGQYEYEYNIEARSYTGRYRCVGGRLADGRWPAWHSATGEKSYS